MYERRHSGGVSVSADIINTFFSGFKLKNRINTTFSLKIGHRVYNEQSIQAWLCTKLKVQVIMYDLRTLDPNNLHAILFTESAFEYEHTS